ncbi:MAG: SlyX family protein [Deltaproteobacteria bacterium]
MDNRVTALEEKVAHLGKVIDDLSDVIARQDRDVDRLTRRVALLMEREATREAEGLFQTPAIDKPPHY